MRFFNKKELVAVSTVLVFVVVVTFSNLKVSNQKARDAQRRSDVRALADALTKYQSEFSFFPPDIDGKILACKGDSFDEFVETQDASRIESFFDLLQACQWGRDALADLTEESTIYMKHIPSDPKSDQGYSYLYLSNSKRFQIYAFLEGGLDAEQFDAAVVSRGLNCGVNICNFGVSFSGTPIDRSIEEYEEELRILLENE